MTLEEALAYIHRVDWRGSVPGLERIDALLGKLGHPERSVKYIHVTGTNGKGSTCAMLASVLPRLCIVNLHTAALPQGDFLAAVRDQLTLYPEYLLPALWPEQDKRGRHTLLRLAAWALAFDVGMHLILELFYGAAMPLRIDPVHAAARCGSWPSRSSWLSTFMRWCGCWAGRTRPRTAPPGWIGFLCIRAASGFCARCCASSI